MAYENNTKLKITADGIEIPDIETIYNSIINEWNDAFGGNLRTENRLSPQGQLAMSIAKQIDDKNKALLYFVNQFNTNTAQGNFLDSLYNNFGVYRTKGSKSEVICECTLQPNITINIGDQVKNSEGDIFECTEEYTSPENEEITTKQITFVSREIGAIGCKENTINEIVSQKEGWLSVNNSSAGNIGTVEENDDQFRIRAINSHAVNALGTNRALYAKLMELDEVNQVYIQTNRTKESITYDSITITPNSTYVCIKYDGQENTKNKIANIMHLVCSTSTYIGNTSIDVPIENAPNNMVDTINFQTAGSQKVYLKVSVKNLTNFSDTTKNSIIKIILDNFNGDIENIQPCQIGELIEANRFYENLVYLQGTNEAVISKIEISSDNKSWNSNLKIPVTKYPFISSDNITIEISED